VLHGVSIQVKTRELDRLAVGRTGYITLPLVLRISKYKWLMLYLFLKFLYLFMFKFLLSPAVSKQWLPYH
jgi:hypothetical protein